MFCACVCNFIAMCDCPPPVGSDYSWEADRLLRLSSAVDTTSPTVVRAAQRVSAAGAAALRVHAQQVPVPVVDVCVAMAVYASVCMCPCVCVSLIVCGCACHSVCVCLSMSLCACVYSHVLDVSDRVLWVNVCTVAHGMCCRCTTAGGGYTTRASTV